jgi:hypothetical protein
MALAHAPVCGLRALDGFSLRLQLLQDALARGLGLERQSSRIQYPRRGSVVHAGGACTQQCGSLLRRTSLCPSASRWLRQLCQLRLQQAPNYQRFSLAPVWQRAARVLWTPQVVVPGKRQRLGAEKEGCERTPSPPPAHLAWLEPLRHVCSQLPAEMCSSSRAPNPGGVEGKARRSARGTPRTALWPASPLHRGYPRFIGSSEAGLHAAPRTRRVHQVR